VIAASQPMPTIAVPSLTLVPLVPLGAHRRAVSRLFALVDPERAVGAQPRRVREEPSA
jgi:hypothetical protein